MTEYFSDIAKCKNCKHFDEKKKHCRVQDKSTRPEETSANFALDEEKKKKNDKKDDKVIEKKKADDIHPIMRPTLIVGDVLYEQVVGGQYVFQNGNGFSYVDHVTVDDTTFVPCSGEELEMNIVLLPTMPEEYGSFQELITEIQNHIHKWTDVTPDFEFLTSYYAPLSYIYDRVNTLPYLSEMGDTGTGKTRTMRTTGGILYRPIISSGASTVAALKRMIKKWQGSLLMDESDIKDSDEKAEIIKLLNLGFQKNQCMFNCNKEDPNLLEFFDPYCPKNISRRRQFEDAAVEARCYTEVMRQTNRNDIPELETKAFYEEQQTLRNKLLKFRFDYWQKIDMDQIMNVDLGEIEPRLRQVARAFLPLLANIPGSTEIFKAFLKVHGLEIVEERSCSFDGQIVNAIASRLEQGYTNISSSDLVNLLQTKDPVSPAYLGKRLRALHLVPRQKVVDGHIKRCIPLDDNLVGVLRRYVSDGTLLHISISAISALSGSPTPPESTPFEAYQQNSPVSLLADNADMLIGFLGSVGGVLRTKVELLSYMKVPSETKVFLVEELEKVCLTNKLDFWLEDLIKSGEVFCPRPGEVVLL
jgi:hypothetical protein